MTTLATKKVAKRDTTKRTRPHSQSAGSSFKGNVLCSQQHSFSRGVSGTLDSGTDFFTYVWHVAEARRRHQLLARELLEVVGELLAVLEVPDEGREVVEAPEGELVAPGELGRDGLGLVAEHDLLDHADALLAQDL